VLVLICLFSHLGTMEGEGVEGVSGEFGNLGEMELLESTPGY
jgi:hypothetical protein